MANENARKILGQAENFRGIFIGGGYNTRTTLSVSAYHPDGLPFFPSRDDLPGSGPAEAVEAPEGIELSGEERRG